MKKSLISSLLLFVAIAACNLAPLPAAATILFASSEDTGFTLNGGADGQSSTIRSTFEHASINPGLNASAADPPGNRITTPTFTSTSNLWVHAQMTTSNVANGTNSQVVLVRSPDGVSRIVVRETGTSGQLKVSTRNAAGTLTDLATASANITVYPFALDLHINYTCSGAGGVQLYLQGVQVINYSGNPCTDSATQLNQADFAGLTISSGGYTNSIAEVIIADEDTRGMALWTLAQQAAGATQNWTPNTLADISKTVINDATSIGTTTANQLTEWTTPTAAPSGVWTVRAIVQEARVSIGTGGPQHFEWVAHTTDGSDNVTGSVAPTTSFVSYGNQIWANNPHTGSAWGLSDIGTNFALGIESLN